MMTYIPALRTRNMRAMAADLGVDMRTVRRDAKILQAAGFAQTKDGCVWSPPDQLALIHRMATEPDEEVATGA